jgi:hypothetical protein
MNYVKNIEVRKGVDVGYHSSNIDPINREGCVGSQGIDKSFTFEKILELAYKIDEKNRPNIILNAGPNAKWYMKRFQKDDIEKEINKQSWRNTTRGIMYIIDWDTV